MIATIEKSLEDMRRPKASHPTTLALQRLCGSLAQLIHRLPYFPGQWRLASLLVRLAPENKLLLKDKFGFCYLVDSGSHIAHLLMLNRSCEPELLTLIDDRQDQVILDVGAHAGTFSLPASRKARLVIAIDADAELCETLKLTLKINGIRNIQVVNSAISNMDEPSIEFFRATSNRSISSLDAAHVQKFDAFQRVTVPNTTLEALLERMNVEKVDVLKIDAENYSGAILRSLRSRLGTVRTIICEPSADLPLDRIRTIAPGHSVRQPFRDHMHLEGYTRETLVLSAKNAR